MNDYLARRRDRVAQAWGLADEFVLIGAGEPVPIPGGADQAFPYASHAEYFYLTDHECPGAVLAFDPKEGWTDFVPDVTEAERVFEALAEGGQVTMPIAATFWSPAFGMCVDRFGTPWMVSAEPPAQPS